MAFNWHSDPITRTTAIDGGYKNTQNVRRFLCADCGPGFAFDRALMAWIRSGAPRTVGAIADEWRRRQAGPGVVSRPARPARVP